MRRREKGKEGIKVMGGQWDGIRVSWTRETAEKAEVGGPGGGRAAGGDDGFGHGREEGGERKGLSLSL